MEEILEKMKRDLDKVRTDLITCVNPTQLDGLAYELIVKSDIVNNIEDEIIDITEYIDDLKQYDNPLDRIYNIFMDMVLDYMKIVNGDRLYSCLNIIKNGETYNNDYIEVDLSNFIVED